MGQPEVYDALRARAWLMVGGQFGLHHLYMDEPLEAFIYFSTAGLFLMGVLFDAFAIHSIVRRRNALLRRFVLMPFLHVLLFTNAENECLVRVMQKREGGSIHLFQIVPYHLFQIRTI